jgi:hypothetical protein
VSLKVVCREFRRETPESTIGLFGLETYPSELPQPAAVSDSHRVLLAVVWADAAKTAALISPAYSGLRVVGPASACSASLPTKTTKIRHLSEAISFLHFKDGGPILPKHHSQVDLPRELLPSQGPTLCC